MVSPKMSGDIGRVRKIGGRGSSFEVKSLNCQDSFGPVCVISDRKRVGWTTSPTPVYLCPLLFWAPWVWIVIHCPICLGLTFESVFHLLVLSLNGPYSKAVVNVEETACNIFFFFFLNSIFIQAMKYQLQRLVFIFGLIYTIMQKDIIRMQYTLSSSFSFLYDNNENLNRFQRII